MRNKSWQQLEDFITEFLSKHDPYARPTKGSGNKGEKHDIKTSCGLAIECKDNQSLKNGYKENDMKKIIDEVPLHSQDIPILVTRNKEKVIRVHLTWSDFWEIYSELLHYRNEDV